MKGPSRWATALRALAGMIALSVVAGILAAAGTTPAVAVVATAASNGINSFNGLPDYLAIRPPDQRTTFYAASGGKEVPIATFYYQNRVDVAWQDVAQSVKDALVATEDPRFYQEGGIDVLGTIRGAVSTLIGHHTEGGSSITQQYVKNVLVQRCDNDFTVNANAAPAVMKKQEAAFQECYRDAAGVTIPRKLREMRYAVGLEKVYSKEQIMLGYLNLVGFGGNIYGIQAASEYYFGVAAKDLTLPQAATLIAIENSPNYLRIDGGSTRPTSTSTANTAADGFAPAKQRRNYVLDRMYVHHKITKQQRDAAKATPITPKITPTPTGCEAANQYNAGFFCSYVQDVMLQDPAFGKTADDRQALFRRGGLQVYTTLNLDLQNKAQQAIAAYIPTSRPGVDLGAANVSLEVGTGRIVTMVENKTFQDSGTASPGATAVNYTTDSARGGSAGFEVGSSFKAYDLGAWLEAGHTIYETVNGTHHVFPESEFATCGPPTTAIWNVANDAPGEGGYMSVLKGTEASVNSVFAQMGTKLNMCAISNVAKSLLVRSASPQTNPWTILPPFMIGSGNYISPLAQARAYAGIANNGNVCTQIAIDRVTDSIGKALPVPKSTCTQGMPANIAHTVSWTLQHVLTAGTATGANPHDGTQIMGKTGTTDQQLSNWLVTSTSKIAQATWVGNVSGSVNFAHIYFHGIAGNNVKFNIDRKILAALDQAYPAPNLPPADPTMLYGANYNPHPTPTKSATPAPPPSPAPTSPTPTSTPSPTSQGNPAGGNGAAQGKG